ncbi:TolC family protein [Candidatus Bandiella numerosa]|uniref:TolC family protein n=1 Tax=Candidatus Bandiella numerosa TaxID=2570586 RepID=UPI001F2EFDC4|nr:TolC family protein [Candidatus Bandiella numerosa]
MNKNRFFKVALLTLFFASNFNYVGAYSLKDAVNSTLLNNEQLQMSKKKLEIAILEKPKAATEFLPSIGATLNKTFYNPSNTKDYNGQSSFNKELFGLNIQQDIFTGGSTIAKIAQADAKINAAYQEYNKALNEILLNTIKSYQNVLTSRELVKVQQTNVNMAQKSLEKAEITVKTGAETKTSLFLAKANLASMKSNLEDYLVGRTQAESSFQYYVGEEAPKIMEQIDVKKYAKIKSFDEFKVLVNTQNSDLIRVKNELKAAKQGVNLAASELLPNVNLFANSSRPKYSDNNPFKGSDLKGNTYGVGVNVPLLYRGGVQYLNISEAKKKSKSAEFSARDVINKIQSQAISVWNQYISSENIYTSSRVAEDNFYQTYLSTQSEFDVGAKTLIDVINRQRDYNNNVIQRLSKEKDYKISLFETYNLVGSLPKIMQSSEEVKSKNK